MCVNELEKDMLECVRAREREKYFISFYFMWGANTMENQLIGKDKKSGEYQCTSKLLTVKFKAERIASK